MHASECFVFYENDENHSKIIKKYLYIMRTRGLCRKKRKKFAGQWLGVTHKCWLKPKSCILIANFIALDCNSMFMIFLLNPLQNPAIVTSQCKHYIFCQGREIRQADACVLPVMKKEGKGKGKWTIGPRMKNGRANLCDLT